MVKKILFVLPLDKDMPSSYVRALCLKDAAPNTWEFLFIYGPTGPFSSSRLSRLKILLHYLAKIARFYDSRKWVYVYFIKPPSPLIVFITRFLLRFRAFVDINDPIHLKGYLGNFSRLKARLILLQSNGIIFESPEYRKFWGAPYYAKSCVVEDTPQFSHLFDNYHCRERRVVWFGSPATSHVLLDYMQYLLLFNKYKYRMLILGGDSAVLQEFVRSNLAFEAIAKYDHEKLVTELANSKIAFVPMPDKPSYSLRGNLKAKFGMACGCITFASNIEMHRRLIIDGENGLLFDDLVDFEHKLQRVESCETWREGLAKSANQFVATTFTVERHAKSIADYFEHGNWQFSRRNHREALSVS